MHMIEIKSKGIFNNNTLVKFVLTHGWTQEIIYCEISPIGKFIEDSFIKNFLTPNQRQVYLAQSIKDELLEILNIKGENK